MEQKGLRTGHFVALTGALVAFASLWRPWYTISLPPELRDAIGGEVGKDPGLLGQMARGLVAALPQTISASGWQELGGADVAVCVGALAVIALILGAAGLFGTAVRIDPAAAGRWIAVLGGAGVVLAVVHVVHRPLDSDLVHVADGLWIALGGAAATLVGGLLAGADGGASAPVRARSQPDGSLAATFPPLDPELPPVFAPAPGASSASVAPPGA
jgi:hypothetical protein